MSRKRNNPVLLSAEDRQTLQALINCGHAPARELTHARILLKADEGEEATGKAWPDVKIADALEPLEISRSTVAGCERDSWRRAGRPLYSIASRKTSSPKSSTAPRRRI